MIAEYTLQNAPRRRYADQHGEGAEAILNLAVSPAHEGQSGLYFNGLREARAHSQAYDAEARQRLWALSLKLTELSSGGLARAG